MDRLPAGRDARKSPGSLLSSIWCVCILLSFNSAVHALGTTGEIDFRRLITSRTLLIDEENFAYDSAWDQEWFLGGTGFRTAVGSISKDRSFIDMDARLRADLLGNLSFEYRYHIEESYIRNHDMHRMELLFGNSKLRAGVCGMIDSYKENNDAGISVAWIRESMGWLKLRLMFDKVLFNTKTSGEDRYLVRPFEWQIESAWESGRWMLYGDGQLSNRWKLDSGSQIQEHHDRLMNLGFTLSFDPHVVHVKAVYRHYLNRIVGNSSVLEDQSLQYFSLKAEYRLLTDNATEWLVRAGIVSVSGDDIADQVDGLADTLPTYQFSRDDFILSSQYAMFLPNDQSVRLTALFSSSWLDIDPLLSYAPAGHGDRLKCAVTYCVKMASRSELQTGLAFNVSEQRFGGGFARFSVYP